MKKLITVAALVLATLPVNGLALEPPAPTIWYKVGWMGPFFCDFEAVPPWMHHASLGWLYVGNDDSYNLWIWGEELGWFYTSWTLNPVIWTVENGWAWIHMPLIAQPDRQYSATGWLYYYETGSWAYYDSIAQRAYE